MLSDLSIFSKRTIKPLSLVHFVTARCNARCSHCFIDFTNPDDPALELSTDEISKLTCNLGTTLYNVNLTGGEPFLRNDLFEIVKCYTENTSARSIVITTNGWHTDKIKELVTRYAKLNTTCVLKISISIDNFEEEHNKGRNLEDGYARAVESFLIASRCNSGMVNADVAITVTPHNADNVVSLYHDLTQKGITDISPILFREEGVITQISDRQRIAEAYRSLCVLAEKRPSQKRSGLTAALHRSKNKISHNILHKIFLKPGYRSTCQAGSLFANIHTDGTVSPCELLCKTMTLGNLRSYDMNFLDLWNSSCAQKARNTIRSNRCNCSFECAWTVNIITTPKYWHRLAIETVKEML